ncbi:MAG: flippase [Patescibacteria group bacterium]|nr:flippase [Patescibacteria group bacterium]
MEKIKNFLFKNINPKQTVIKNAFWLYLSEGISKGLRILVFILISRMLGPEKLGLFEYLYSFVGFFFIFADMGISYIFIRDYQQREEKQKYFSNAFSLKVILSIFFSLMAILGYPLAKKSDNFLAYMLIVIFYLLANIENMLEAYFLAIQKVEKKLVFLTINSIVFFAIITYGLLIYPSILVVIVGYLGGTLFGLIVAYVLFLLEKREKLTVDFSLTHYYFKNGFALALFGTLTYIFFATDKIILAYFRSFEDIGHYSIASRVINATLFLTSLFGTSLYPYLAQKAVSQDNRDKIFKIFYKLLLISLVSGFVFSFVIYLLSPYIVPFIFGKDFLPSVPLIKLLSWILIFVFPTVLLDFTLISYHRQWLDFWITLIPAIFNIGANFILIPSMGVVGAIITSISSQALNFMISFVATIYVLKKYHSQS